MIGFGSDISIDAYRGAAIGLGNFDGLHLGHMRLIGALTRRASELGVPAIVYTFSEHPRNVLQDQRGFALLTDAQKKRSLLAGASVDGVYFEKFDAQFAAQSPEEFVRGTLVTRFGARLAVAGQNFRFGRGGEGDAGDLEGFGKKYGFEVEIVEPYYAGAPDKNPVSSSDVRSHIQAGRMENAAALLGRLYSLRGRAEFGRIVCGGGLSGVFWRDPPCLAPPAGAYAIYARVRNRVFKGRADASEKGFRFNLASGENLCGLHEAEIEIFFYKRLD